MKKTINHYMAAAGLAMSVLALGACNDEWDDHYDQSMNGVNMQVMKISGLKYVIVFDKFELEDIEDDEVKDTVYNLFNGLIEDKDDIPFDLVLNADNITWK